MKIGQKIRIDYKLVRVEQFKKSEEGHPISVRHKKWVAKELVSRIDVIVIGKRTLWNGTTFYDSGICLFEPKDKFPAYLVVEAMHKKPFYIHADDSVLVADSLSTEIN